MFTNKFHFAAYLSYVDSDLDDGKTHIINVILHDNPGFTRVRIESCSFFIIMRGTAGCTEKCHYPTMAGRE